MATINQIIESIFPNLSSEGYQLTSPPTPNYNCIAWSVANNQRWWWPDGTYYWPAGLNPMVTVDAFIAMYKSFDYEVCIIEDYETGFEKIALYALADGTPTHAARQLPNGRWTSKLGPNVDIEHTLKGIINLEYGRVVKLFKKATQR